jgi:predicted alpha/beta-fold hydrolase
MRNPHFQTIVAARKPRRFTYGWNSWESMEIDLGVDGRIVAEASWQPGDRARSPGLFLLHGMEGSAQSHYLVGTSKKAYARGFHVIRVNTRNCGGTEHLTPTLYCAGLSQDVGAIVDHLRRRCGIAMLYAFGVSLGANILLKHLGEQGCGARESIRAAAVLSTPIDLEAGARRIDKRSNWIYQRYFVSQLIQRMRRRLEFFPGIADMRRVQRIRTIYEFDDVVTAPHFGYGSADEYYRKTSAAPLLHNIRVPTLMIQAADDPLLPFDSFRDSGIEENPFLYLLATEYGGHAGFLTATRAHAADLDCYWAESRAVDFLMVYSGTEPDP